MGKKKVNVPPRATESKKSEKRTKFLQSDFPQNTLQQAQRIAAAIVDNFAGKQASPPDIALAIGISPTSSGWRSLTGSSGAYGLTDGGFNANSIKLTALGSKLVSPTAEGDDIEARREAILKPRISKEFFEQYRRAKFPSDVIGSNVLKNLGIPFDRAKAALDIMKANGQYAGIIRDTPTGPFVSLDSPVVPSPSATSINLKDGDDEGAGNGGQFNEVGHVSTTQDTHVNTNGPAHPPVDSKINRVFITHGKQKAIVTQIKELLSYGKFEPIVSVERESMAIPVPEKVFEDMRSCGAGVIHVGAEGTYTDRSGTTQPKINDNVLIEIGAAMALFGKKVILLVEKGIQMPSNLQGLYRCEFEGDQLDYASTMKLLKTFTQFR